MGVYSICIVGGWCGNRMVIVADHLREYLASQNYLCKIFTASVWDHYSAPPQADLILQLLPAYTESETGCPILLIKPLLLDLSHPETLSKILQRVSNDHPSAKQELTEGNQTGSQTWQTQFVEAH